MRMTHRFIPGLLAGSLLAGGASGALAAKNHPASVGLARAAGQVSNLSATGFTLTETPRKATQGTTAAVKTVQINLTAATRETAVVGTTGALANGEYVVVAGQKTATGITARRVLYSVKPIHRAHNRVTGTVQGSTATTLTVQTRKGKLVTFTLTAQTRYRAGAQALQAVPAFTAGERVAVSFKRDKATKVVTAVAVVVLPAKPAQP